MKRIVVRHVILMTEEQYKAWADEYGLDNEGEVPDDICRYLHTNVCDSIGTPGSVEYPRAQEVTTTLSVRKRKGEK